MSTCCWICYGSDNSPDTGWCRNYTLTDVMAAADKGSFSALYFYLKLVNAVILVAIFEELFIRVYVMGWLHQAGLQRQEKGLLGSIVDTFEVRPDSLKAPPLSTFSVVGRQPSFLPPAIRPTNICPPSSIFSLLPGCTKKAAACGFASSSTG